MAAGAKVEGRPELRKHANGTYYAYFYSNEKGEFHQSTGERESVAKASRAAKRMISEWLGTQVEQPKEILLEAVYLEALKLKESKSANTAANFKFRWKHLGPAFGKYRIVEFEKRGAAIWENYIVDKKQEHPNLRFTDHKKELVFILCHAKRAGYIREVPKLRNPDMRSDVGKEYSDEELAKLYQHAKPNFKGKRRVARLRKTIGPTSRDNFLSIQIDLALKQGMRKGEIMPLRKTPEPGDPAKWKHGWADTVNGIIVLPPLAVKTRTARRIPMNPDVQRELAKLSLETVGAYFFPSPNNPDKPQRGNNKAWQRCKRAAGVSGRFHDLRHTSATRLLRAGVPPAIVQKTFGFSDKVMRAIYQHLSFDDMKLATQQIRGNFSHALPSEAK